MTGRGIDQVMPHPVNPVLYEPYLHDAREYVNLPRLRTARFRGPWPSTTSGVTLSKSWSARERFRASLTSRLRLLPQRKPARKKSTTACIPGQHRLHHYGSDRLLLSREQSRSRLGLRRTGRNDRDVGEGRCSSRRCGTYGYRSNDSRSARFRWARPCSRFWAGIADQRYSPRLGCNVGQAGCQHGRDSFT
jgi:hypothetical protein